MNFGLWCQSIRQFSVVATRPVRPVSLALTSAALGQPAGASSLFGFLQRRWATRGGFRGGNLGNTYQPNTLKRKRRLGFLARACSRTGRKILKRRKEKGRWFLTH
ncbi:hypothetical protein KL916_005192 [Ogataea parapolymorpha]|nr:hypothetical protein KL916_005192 [Ogataea parapolymorpha]